MKASTIEEVLARLIPQPPAALATGCLVWPDQGDGDGYGRVHFNGRRARVHTIVYEQLVAPVPPGQQIHHRCKNRACANIEHLELVNTREHGKRHRKTHCPQGHPYATEGRRRHGSQDCRVCHREREYRRSQKARETKAYTRGPYQTQRLRRPITPERVKEVRRLAAKGWRPCDIARAFDLSASHVCQIISRRSWADLDDD